MKNTLKNRIEEDMNELIYKNPKCDFEHIWNCAVSETINCLTGFTELEE